MGNVLAMSSTRAWMLSGLLIVTLAGVIDTVIGRETVLIGTLAIGPLIAAIGTSPGRTAIVALYAVALALPLGARDGLWGTRDLTVRTVVVGIVGAAATISARVRDLRESELVTTRPKARLAERLRVTLDAGRTGTWRWDLATGRIEWDERLEDLFGLDPGQFDETFEMYRQLLYPDDRDRVLAAVDEGMRTNTPWRFDHRVVHADGSVHWLEGKGEPLLDSNGTIIGATGVTTDIDERRALFDAERAARGAAEQSTRALRHLAEVTVALSAAATVDEVGAVIVHAGVEALRARSGYFATVDDDTDELVMRAQSGYPRWIVRDFGRVPMSSQVPGTDALRTGRPIFIESPADRQARYPQFADDAAHAAFVVIPLPRVASTNAVIAFGFGESRTYDEDDHRYITAVVEACAQALRRASAFEAEQQSRLRLRTLLETSERLAGLDDPERVAEAIASIASSRLGRCASVIVLERGGRLTFSAAAHTESSLSHQVRALVDQFNQDMVRKVLESGEPQLLGELVELASPSADPASFITLADQVGCREWLLVPITVAGRRLALLAIGSDGPDRIRPADVELAVDVARRGGSAIERAQLWQAEQQRAAEILQRSEERARAEHRLVELLQRTIMPDELPALPGLELTAAYQPAEVDVEVGGDWYDAFVAPDGRVVLAVGDVAGHGVDAANLMSRVRNALRAYAVENCNPGPLLRRLNALLGAFDDGAMVTAFIACYDPVTRDLAWARAGHPPPLLVDPAGSVQLLEEVNDVPLGTFASDYAECITPLPPGALLVCYTDGLVERRDRSIDDGIEWLGSRVLELADQPLASLCRRLLSDPFVPRPSPDDVCLLVVRADPAS